MNDLSGKKFGNWTVLCRDFNKNKVYYKCRCKCGVEKSVRSDALVSGKSSSCKSCMKLNDHTGKIYNSWKVIKYDNGKWLCQCLKCGTIKAVHIANLISGKSTKCRKCGTSKTHGKSDTRLYHIWHHVKNRCNNPNCDSYKNYGGRGVTICDEWLNFTNFNDWSIKNGYQNNLTIDRIDVNRGYSPDNCRWVDLVTQQRENKRTLHLITYNNETRCLSEWAKIYNINYGTLRERLKRGWTFERAVNLEV